jgi:hypothetical protein
VEVEPYFKKFDKIYWTSRVQPTEQALRAPLRCERIRPQDAENDKKDL